MIPVHAPHSVPVVISVTQPLPEIVVWEGIAMILLLGLALSVMFHWWEK